MHMEAFGAMEKMWKKNSNEHFDPSDIIFVDNNRSLRFSSLLPDDSGVYTCCRRISPSDGYHCIDRKVKVVDGDDVLNATEGTNTIYAWNIDLISEDILYGREGNAYFLKLFYENATDIHNYKECRQGRNLGLFQNKPIPEPLHHDVVIQSFNSTLHSGTYECNGTVASGNKTNVEQVKSVTCIFSMTYVSYLEGIECPLS
ncbi:unnamed protein product [Heligmosomoides polygyrus]|uniref:Ig-like domain-containing protein n=1 Tax=Heligmosomoides polygyrus TaxID=6339 RepID=A0A183FXU8_HELPZ|nr:unnamed protein product [Heligmosomoides polygyrus]